MGSKSNLSISKSSVLKVDLSEANISKYCRVCMKNTNRRKPLFNPVGVITEKIAFCTGVQFQEEDNLPAFICIPCLDDLVIAYQFKKKVLDSDKALRKVRPKNEILSETNIKSSSKPLVIQGEEVKNVLELLNIRKDISIRPAKVQLDQENADKRETFTVKSNKETPKLDDDKTMIVDSWVPEIKRPRGRPRKSQPTITQPTVKRGRGRPRKHQPTNILTVKHETATEKGDDELKLDDQGNNEYDDEHFGDVEFLDDDEDVKVALEAVKLDYSAKSTYNTLTTEINVDDLIIKDETKYEELGGVEEKNSDEKYSVEFLDDLLKQENSVKVENDDIGPNLLAPLEVKDRRRKHPKRIDDLWEPPTHYKKKKVQKRVIVAEKKKRGPYKKKIGPNGKIKKKPVKKKIEEKVEADSNVNKGDNLVKDDAKPLSDDAKPVSDDAKPVSDDTKPVSDDDDWTLNDKSNIDPILPGQGIFNMTRTQARNKYGGRKVRLNRNLAMYCDVCDIKFTDSKECRAHRNSHETSLICEFCGYDFTNCCERTAYAHRMMHEPARYWCNDCDFKSIFKQDLQKHILAKHLKIQIQHLCLICSKLFRSPGGLRCHIQAIHEKIRRHTCEYCGRQFYDKGKYKRHIDTHLKIKRHECIFCHSRFTRITYLKKHVLEKHGVSGDELPVTQKRGRPVGCKCKNTAKTDNEVRLENNLKEVKGEEIQIPSLVIDKFVPEEIANNIEVSTEEELTAAVTSVLIEPF